MKVAFDHQIFSMQRYGGVSRYFFELLNKLPANGVSVSVIAPLYINNYVTVDPPRKFISGKYVPYDFALLPQLVGLADQLVAPLAWLGSGADIVHETYFSMKPVGKAKRRVVTVYDMIHELFADEFPDAKLVSAAKRAAVNRADHVICISENTQRDLVRLFGIDPARTSAVHLGYSLTATADDATVKDGEYRSSLLYVGGRGGYKNFRTLLQAYASSPTLRECELIAFGGGPFLPQEQEEIHRLGVADRVRFESGSDQALAARYRSAAAFVYPSLYEGFGLPPLEAMSHGCPVVCSSAGPIPEVVGDAGIYFDPTSVEDLRTALERVVTTAGLRETLRKRGSERLAVFSWDKCAAETAQIYRELV